MKRVIIALLLAATLCAAPPLYGGNAYADAPAVIPEVTIAAHWDPDLTFTFTDVYETCVIYDGELGMIYTTEEGTMVISKDARGRFFGDMAAVGFEGGTVFNVDDLYEGVENFQDFYNENNYTSFGVSCVTESDAEGFFGEAGRQPRLGNIRDYLITKTINAAERPYEFDLWALGRLISIIGIRIILL